MATADEPAASELDAVSIAFAASEAFAVTEALRSSHDCLASVIASCLSR